MTWDEMIRIEPQLAELLNDARAVRSTGDDFCANDVWYGYGPVVEAGLAGLKARLCSLVGFGRDGDGYLGTPEAYDLAYQTIYNALPNCGSRCGCMRVGEDIPAGVDP